jgi:hypothetical protein
MKVLPAKSSERLFKEDMEVPTFLRRRGVQKTTAGTEQEKIR